MGTPFNEQEEEIMNLIIEAHDKFIKLPRTHASEIYEWVEDIHGLQHLLTMRVMRRLYPDYFKQGL